MTALLGIPRRWSVWCTLAPACSRTRISTSLALRANPWLPLVDSSFVALPTASRIAPMTATSSARVTGVIALGQAPLPVPQQRGNRPSAYFSHDPIFSHGDRLSLTQACKRCTSRYIHGHGPPPSLCIAPLLLSVIPQPRQLPLSCRGESGRHPGSAFTEQLRITHEGPSLNRWSCHDALGTRGWESSQDTRTPTNNILPLTNPTSLAN